MRVSVSIGHSEVVATFPEAGCTTANWTWPPDYFFFFCSLFYVKMFLVVSENGGNVHVFGAEEVKCNRRPR